MKVSPRFYLRTVAMLLGVAAIAFSWSCIERPMKVADPAPDVISDFSALQGATRDVDLLFVIDNSLSMQAEQQTLRSNFTELMRVLKLISGGLPNVHIGVTSTDLGVSPYSIPSCEVQGGDNGRLLKGVNNACANPVNQNFIVDVEPRGCNIERNADDDTVCETHDCAQANCEQSVFVSGTDYTEPSGLTFAVDDKGCPRCRNYSGQTLEEVFSCTADIGIQGCGFEQQLESMYKALTNTAENPAFYRAEALLAVFFITDEDDCSAKNPEIFNSSVTSLDSTLGPLTSFRCTEFGIVCDQDWQRVMPAGTASYTNCHARPDNDARSMLHPITKYVNYLLQLKDADSIIVGAIAGPYEGNLTVGVDGSGYPKLSYVCGPADAGAVPGVRMKEFVEAFNPDVADMTWAYTSVCSASYTGALEGLGNKIKNLVEVQCITTPLNGCPDPAAANGEEPITSLPADQAAVCTPNCTVMDVFADGVNEIIQQCPACSDYPDVCSGEWGKIARNLPYEKCFYVRYNEKCADPLKDFGPSRGAEIIISRQEPAEAGTNAKITCQGLPLTEKLCADGLDNDMDGLVDDADPDCVE